MHLWEERHFTSSHEDTLVKMKLVPNEESFKSALTRVHIFATVRFAALRFWNGFKVFDKTGYEQLWKYPCYENILTFTLPETNSSHLKMDGWTTIFFLGRFFGLFSGANLLLVSGRVTLLSTW